MINDAFSIQKWNWNFFFAAKLSDMTSTPQKKLAPCDCVLLPQHTRKILIHVEVSSGNFATFISPFYSFASKKQTIRYRLQFFPRSCTVTCDEICLILKLLSTEKLCTYFSYFATLTQFRSPPQPKYRMWRYWRRPCPGAALAPLRDPPTDPMRSFSKPQTKRVESSGQTSSLAHWLILMNTYVPLIVWRPSWIPHGTPGTSAWRQHFCKFSHSYWINP